MGKFKDLTGQKFGKLTVLGRAENHNSRVCWHCRCNCGNLRDVITADLLGGRVYSCKMCGLNRRAKKRMSTTLPPIVGVFTPIERVLPKNYKGNYRWKYRCVCGNIVESTPHNMAKRHNTDVCTCGKLHKHDDLTGHVFGRLTVISKTTSADEPIWHCRCSCSDNSFVDVYADNLISGHTKSCGCYAKEQTSKAKLIDLTGRVFGRWEVLGRSEVKRTRVYWRCRCTCDKHTIKDVSGTSLVQGKSTSCGCYNSEAASERQMQDLTGKVFGLWRVDEKVRISPTYYRCTCLGCGKVREVAGGALVAGVSTSCGCSFSYFRGSNAELAIKDFCDNLCGGFEKSKILGRKEIDMYNEELKLGIEYNGSIYHATINGAYKNKLKVYHQQKFLSAKEKGIHLINIFDVDFNRNKDKILAYLKDIIKPEHRVYARNCNIILVDKWEAWAFYDKYHLHGKSYMSQINYGLLYQGELMAVMGFGKLRMKNANKENCYELHRYCIKHGYTVVGGAGKLLRCFERYYAPKYLLSYSDNDYFSGGMYIKLGFKDCGQISIPYYWVKGNKMLKREQCQLKYLKVQHPELYKEAIDNGVSNKEDYIMTSLGYYKVYRSGNTKWEKSYVTI